MKKYTWNFVALLVVLGVANSANAMNVVTTSYAYPDGCWPGDNYSRTIGESCGEPAVAKECSPGDKYSSLTGKPCPVVSSPIISGVRGPQKLEVGEEGTWTVSAYDKSGGNFYYSVYWGDEVYAYPTASSTAQDSVQQSATFTHTYSEGGTYTPKFIVTNESGQSAKTSLSVKVGGPTSVSGVTVVSPNGGEIWKVGTAQYIKWRDPNPVYPCFVAPCPAVSYDITLHTYYPPCTANICPDVSYPYIAPYTIAKGTSSSSYNWTVGKFLESYISVSGKYKIQVCRSDNECDMSDNYFVIDNNITTVATKLLQWGSRGEEVKKLQESLQAAGYNPGTADGIFGQKVKAAVLQFQESKGLKADGIVGAKTQELLNR